MDGVLREMWARMPLAEAVLQTWRWLADDDFLEDFYQRQHGHGRKRILTFAVLVQLIADALVHRGGSARRAFERAREEGELVVSIQAAYGKLRRMPIETSTALLAEATVFQFVFCLLLYNVMQVVRAHVAAGRRMAVAEVSIEKLFEDVREQLQAWRWLIGPRPTLLLLAAPGDAAATARRLRVLLGSRWRERWRKAPKQNRRPATRAPSARTHQSAYRLLTGSQKK